jgi:hypothetical protein
MEHRTEIEEAAYNLAMMALQSARYADDKEFAEAVDRVIGLTLFRDQVMPPEAVAFERMGERMSTEFEPRTIESDLAEDR